ncbi:Rapamycin-insensitive companion of mTOR [Sarcoptes scabiei]|uniref:Rapamycin-insensitive companion of mTOR n=2 Tax=Sarcoptes scabiei TaxID=52283 RepID=A0A834VGG8_SARSC|nr:Rapamycin-insensitive companion of mTOR [Sarcoptes scabiei]
MLKINRSQRNLNRSNRRRFQENEFEIQFDWNQPLNQSCFMILSNICSKESFANKNQLLSYLNLFIKYCLYHHGKLEFVPKTEQNKRDQRSKESSDNTTTNNAAKFHENKTFSDAEVLCCLRISLFHEIAEVRAACLRAIRYFVQSKQTLQVLLELQLQHLIARSLDIILDNRIERIQAFRLVRHMMAIDPKLFPLALARCLCSIANDNLLEKDTLLRACWATIAELTIVNAKISSKSGCINALIRCVLHAVTGFNSSEYDDLLQPSKNRNLTNGLGGMNTTITIPFTNIAISEAILASFMYLYNFPETRRLLFPNGSDLFHFVSPFTDRYSFFHASKAVALRYRLDGNVFDDFNQNQQMDPIQNQRMNRNDLTRDYKLPGLHQQQLNNHNNYEQRQIRYLACKNTILSILRSWPGLFFMCRIGRLSSSSLRREEKHRLHIRKLDFRNILPTKWHFEKEFDVNKQFRNSFDVLNPLESLIIIFHLPYAEVHRYLLEMFAELFNLYLPDCLDDLDAVIRCVYHNHYPVNRTKSCKSSQNTMSSKTCYPDEWQLYDGFVAKEAEDILPNLFHNRLNIVVNYHALLLQSLIEFGLLEALIDLILDSSDKQSVNFATILTAELLYLTGKYLPTSIYAHRCQSLPTLVAASISNCRGRRNRALMAISNFNRIHNIKKNGRPPASLFLEQQIYFCNHTAIDLNRSMDQIAINQSVSNAQKAQSFSSNRIQDESILILIRNSGVLRKSSYKDWNWDMIADLLKQPNEFIRRLEDREIRSLIQRLTQFYSPSNREFSTIMKNSCSTNQTEPTTPTVSNFLSNSNQQENSYCDNPRTICMVAIYFIDFLLKSDENKITEFVEDFIFDLEKCLKNVANKCPSIDEILTPSRLLSTLSSYYFLLLGRFTHFPNGRNWLRRTHIYQYLHDIINLSINEVYIKLIVSSLDYSEPSFSRSILSKVLTSPIESSRIYATKFMRVLLRLGVPDFSKWGVEFLITQLYDQSSAISHESLHILDEACSENNVYLEKILLHRPALLNLGDRGILFFARFASHPSGLRMLYETNMLQNEIDRWRSHYCLRYVRFVEDSINDCFSCHQKSGTGKYGRRSDRKHFPSIKSTCMSAYLAPHLYGQLVQSMNGLQVVIQNMLLEDSLSIVKSQIDHYLNKNEKKFSNELEVLRMKSALWSVGHIASTEIGIDYVIKCDHQIINSIVILAEQSNVISLRSTAFYVICLISSTLKGSEILDCFGWSSIQHSHHDNFPIDQQQFENFHLSPRMLQMNINWEEHQSINPPKSIVSIPSCYFSDLNVEEGFHLNSSNNSHLNSNPNYQFSVSSSSSGSSSYISVLPSNHHHQSSSKQLSDSKSYSNNLANKIMPEMKSAIKVGTSNSSHSHTLSASSTISLDSNVSSIGLLMPTASDDNDRIRSSSDCVKNIDGKFVGSSSAANCDNQLLNSATNPIKAEFKDSGIVDQSQSDQSMSVRFSRDVISPLPRSRKISAPCFSMSNNVKYRSNSNESGQTNNTGSRSTSFTEYSTVSSNLSQDPIDLGEKMERSVSFMKNDGGYSCKEEWPLMAIKSSPMQIYQSSLRSNRPMHGGTKSSLSSISSNSSHRRAPSIVAMKSSDPYPSPIDAYGYAQLRAIQKIRIFSLSHRDLSDLPQNDLIFGPFTTKESKPSPPARIISSNDSDDHGLMMMTQSKLRTLSGSSQMSTLSEEYNLNEKELASNVDANDDIKANDASNSNKINSDNISSISSCQFPSSPSFSSTISSMCLALPQTLSSIFHIDESKTMIETFSSDKMEKLTNVKTIGHKDQHSPYQIHHNSSKCIVCCVDFNKMESLLETMKISNDLKADEKIEETDKPNQDDRSLFLTFNANSIEILKLVKKLSNSITAKQAEQGLLSLKQKFSELFENFCLYSEICILMEQNNFKATARRFLQELFLDMDLEKFYNQTRHIMRKYERIELSSYS